MLFSRIFDPEVKELEIAELKDLLGGEIINSKLLKIDDVEVENE